MNVMISATDRRMEHFASNMFKSFRRIDENTLMMCIAHDLTKKVEYELKDIGVVLTPYSCPKSPYNFRSISMSISNYIPEESEKVLWMDIDALFVSPIDEVWGLDFSMVTLPGFNGDTWTYFMPDGKQYKALGMFVSNAVFLRKLWLEYCGYETQAENKPQLTGHPDEGSFIRHSMPDFDSVQLEGPIYYCGRELVQTLVYDPISNVLWYQKDGKVYRPKCLQFNIMTNGRRPKSKAVDEWIKFNLT